MIIFAACLAGGLYFAVGGWVKVDLTVRAEEAKEKADIKEPLEHKGVWFRNAAQIRVIRQQERIYRWFPWIRELPYLAVLIVTGIALGTVGGVFRILAEMVFQKRKFLELHLAARPALGGLTGVMLLAVTYSVPEVLTVGDSPLRPMAVVSICLLGGAFSEQAYEWLKTEFPTMFCQRKNSKRMEV